MLPENKPNLFSGDYSQFDSQGGTGTLYGYFKLPTDNETYTLTMIAKNDFTPTATTYIGFTGTGGDGSAGVNWLVDLGLGTITKGTKLIKTSQLGYVSIYSKNADTLKKFTDNFDIQLEEGSTATEYEPYGVSPSPDYPSEIESVGTYFSFDEETGKYGIELKVTNGTDTNTSLFVLDQPLRSLPNGVKDIAYIKNNILYVDRKVGSIVLDGSESWQVTSRSNGYQFQTRNSLSFLSRRSL